MFIHLLSKRGAVGIVDFFSDENNPLTPFIKGEATSPFIKGEAR